MKTNISILQFKCKYCGSSNWNTVFLTKNHIAYCESCGKRSSIIVSLKDIKYFKKDLYKKDETIVKVVPKNNVNHKGKYNKKNGVYKHREDYYDNYRDTPRWWHIHHIDCDKSNNTIKNLIALPPALHFSIHNMITKSKTNLTRKEILGLLKIYLRFTDIFRDTLIERTLKDLNTFPIPEKKRPKILPK